MARHANEPFTNGTMGKTSRAVISGSRPFNTAFGLPRNGENIARSSGTFQSGSPPGLATIVRRGTAGRRFFNSLLGYIVFSASDFARFVPLATSDKSRLLQATLLYADLICVNLRLVCLRCLSRRLVRHSFSDGGRLGVGGSIRVHSRFIGT